MTMPHRLRLILFDVDGTLLDSQAHIFEATKVAFTTAGLPQPTLAEVRSGIGLSVDEAMARLAPGASDTLVAGLATTYRKTFRDIAQRMTDDEASPLFEGARDVLDKLAREDAVVLGVATGKSRRGLERMVDAHGLAGTFQTIQVADGHPSKPHPSMIQTAIAETGVSRERTIMIGDTSYDMLMAKAAQVRGIGVAWGYHPPEDLSAAGAVAIAEDFADLYDLIRDLI